MEDAYQLLHSLLTKQKFETKLSPKSWQILDPSIVHSYIYRGVYFDDNIIVSTVYKPNIKEVNSDFT